MTRKPREFQGLLVKLDSILGGGTTKELSERRILIVDDVKSYVMALAKVLEGDYKVSIALNGEGALRSVRTNPPDLVLLDVMMPGMSGHDVCRQIRSNPATAEIPVIFLTGLDDVENKMAGFDAGGNDYVTKPFEVLEVKARVKAMLQARAYQEARQELLSQDLRIAREIQMSLIPRNFARWQQAGAELFGLVEPAREVGGDLYTVFPASQGRMGILFGDVSGKGVHAALFMAIATTLARTASRQASNPSEVLSYVNDELAAENPSEMFVTLLCAFLDLETGSMLCASGGHAPPVLMSGAEPPSFAFSAPGTLVGVEPGLVYPANHINLRPGDFLIIYTDGVTEAFNPNDEEFGDKRLLDYYSACRPGWAREAAEGLLAAVRRFANGAPQSDDIAILAVRFLGRS